MNLSIKNLSLLFLTILFFNCKKDLNNIGLPSKPQDSIGVFFTDTSSIQSFTILNDPFLTSENSILMVGKEQDPYFGEVQSASYFRLFSPSNSVKIDPASVKSITSVDYTFKINFPGDSVSMYNHVQKIGIYQLPDSLKEASYYTNSEYPNTIDQDRLLGEVFYTYSTRNYLKVSLPPDLGKELLLYNNRDSLLSIHFKGLALLPGKDNNTTEKILSLFNSRPTDSTDYVTIKFKDTANADKMFRYEVGKFKGQKFYNILTNRSNSKLSGLTKGNPLPTAQTENICFVQSGTGVNTKVAFPYLSTLKEKKGVIINKAQLVFYTADLPEGHQENPPLALYSTDATNLSTTYLYDQVGSTTTPKIAYYNKADSSYVFEITEYIRKEITSYLPGNGLIIRPLTVNGSNINDYSITRTKFFDGNYGKGDPKFEKKRMKLLLYYTDISN